MMPMPEHDKLKLVQKESQAIGAFLDWALHDVMLLEFTGPNDIERILGKYFGVDLKKLEAEKQYLLNQILAEPDG